MDLSELKKSGNIKTEEITSSRGKYLYHTSIANYLSDGEEAHFVFEDKFGTIRIETKENDQQTDENKGFIRSIFDFSNNKNKYKKVLSFGKPADFPKAMWITNKGIHLTFGRSSSDFHRFFSYDTIEKFSLNRSNKSHGINEFTFFSNEKRIIFHPGTKQGKPFDYAEDYVRKKLRSVTPESSDSGKSKNKNKTDGTKENSTFDISQINEFEFEQLVSEIWEQQGWTTELTSKSGDRGIDIIAVKDRPVEQRQYIQAKYYSPDNKVGSDEVQKYSGLYAREESVDAVVIVTTSEFTNEAQNVAANRDVKLVDGKKVENMIDEYNI